MTNIWGFLLQTLEVSMVAVILLIVKKLLEDKLSPRWQYGVWSILVMRILLPVNVGIASTLFLPVFPGNVSEQSLVSLPVWLELMKTRVEGVLHSNYAKEFLPVGLEHILPKFQMAPASVTDWLFVIYGAGILFFLVKYLVTYLRLRRILKRSGKASGELLKKAEQVCEKYDLKSCRIVAVEGLTSAFLCGGFKPVLAVPAGADIDEKVLLHELLHLKYYDTVQNTCWCILRSLQWCNPFLQSVFHRIGNDMEALCDQRVLERLEGEERRTYGVILLNMANERYARVPGTSSISNGGKNIARRIESIVRFKKYPKGMALVSVCIVFVLASITVFGMEKDYSFDDYRPKSLSGLERAMAMTRVNRCTTIAGALDTYAKALVFDNGIFLATASPMERQEELYEQMKGNSADGWESNYLRTGYELECYDKWFGYHILNLEKTGEDQYAAVLSFDVQHFHEVKDGAVQGMLKSENGESLSGCVQIPVEIRKEHGWVVEECGPRACVFEESLSSWDDLEALKVLEAAGESGTVKVELRSRHLIENVSLNTASYFTGSQMQEVPQLDAEFEYGYVEQRLIYSLEGNVMEGEPKTYVGSMFKALDSLKEKVEWPKEMVAGDMSGSRSDGFEWASENIADGWNEEFVHTNAGGNSCGLRPDGTAGIPEYYKVRIYWDAKVVEELTLKEVSP